jgi:hypothetical protein
MWFETIKLRFRPNGFRDKKSTQKMSAISRSGCWLEVDLAHEGRPNFGLEKIEKK